MTGNLINPTTVALGLLLVILIVAAVSRLWVAIAASIVATLAFNYFFLPPVGTLKIADPQDWVALFTFLAVSVVASQLSATARARTKEATARRDEVSRLFDVSRDILLMSEAGDAHATLARIVARRFEVEYVAIHRSAENGWIVSEVGEPAAGDSATVVPLRLGSRVVGRLAISSGRPASTPQTLDALSGIVAIAIERIHFLDELKAREMARQGEELKTALLASIAHDLRTPLTAIRVAAENLQADWLAESDRREQSELVLDEVSRLGRLFESILEMARIDAGAVAATFQWVTLSEIVAAARDQAGKAIASQIVDVHIEHDALVRLDPRLTASALAQLIENAARYAPPASTVTISAGASDDGLTISVRDRGPGIAAGDLPHIFDRFYRGAAAGRRISGTGMGLSIARGLLAAEQGRIWAENCVDGGARFTIAVPAEHKALEAHV